MKNRPPRILVKGLTGDRTAQSSTFLSGSATLAAGTTGCDGLGPTYSDPMPNTEHQTLFHDPRTVHQWAMSSATGSEPYMDNVYPIDPFRGDSVCNDLLNSGFNEPICPSAPPASDFSLLRFAKTPEDPHHRTLESDLYTANSGCAMVTDPFAAFPLDPVFDDGLSGGRTYDDKPWTVAESHMFSMPTSPDMLYPTSSEVLQALDTDYPLEDTQLHLCWSEAHSGERDSYSDGPPVYTPSRSTWSPCAVAMDPSVSSSYSQSSLAQYTTGSPTSFTTQEEFMSPDLLDDYATPPLPIGCSTHMPYSSNTYDPLDQARFV